jgi:hypothetical protein
VIQREAERGRDDDRDLLAGRLPARVEALAAGRRHFGEIDRHAAQFGPAEKPCSSRPASTSTAPARRSSRSPARTRSDRAARHDRQRDDQALAAADVVDVRAEHDRAERTHQEAGAEHGEGHQRREFARGRKEHRGDLRRVEAEQEEVELLEEVAGRHAEYRGGLRASGRRAGRGMHQGVSRKAGRRGARSIVVSPMFARRRQNEKCDFCSD